jgi:hypothetical protein
LPAVFIGSGLAHVRETARIFVNSQRRIELSPALQRLTALDQANCNGSNVWRRTRLIAENTDNFL